MLLAPSQICSTGWILPRGSRNVSLKDRSAGGCITLTRVAMRRAGAKNGNKANCREASVFLRTFTSTSGANSPLQTARPKIAGRRLIRAKRD